MNPDHFWGGNPVEMNGWLSWSDLTIWAGLLLVFAYATGTLQEHAEQRLRELRANLYRACFKS